MKLKYEKFRTYLMILLLVLQFFRLFATVFEIRKKELIDNQ